LPTGSKAPQERFVFSQHQSFSAFHLCGQLERGRRSGGNTGGKTAVGFDPGPAATDSHFIPEVVNLTNATPLGTLAYYHDRCQVRTSLTNNS